MKKNKISLVILLTALSLLVFSTTACAQQGAAASNVITVYGSGLVKVEPNMAEISLSVVTEDPQAKEAQANNARLVNQVTSALQKAGVAKDDIITTGYYLNPRYVYEERKAPRISGYEVRNELNVTLRDITQVGQIIDLAVQNGINQVQNVRFFNQGDVAPKKEALRQAVDDARVKAEVLAAALGKKIVGVQSATGTWQDNDPQPILYKQMNLARDEAQGAGTSVNPGLVEIRASAEVVYIIQ